jgi:hypothetical protein
MSETTKRLAELVLAPFVSHLAAQHHCHCQYCDAGFPQIESAFGGFVHTVDGVEYECENPIRSQPLADH